MWLTYFWFFQVVFEKEGVYLHTNAKKMVQDMSLPGFIRVVERVSRPVRQRQREQPCSDAAVPPRLGFLLWSGAPWRSRATAPPPSSTPGRSGLTEPAERRLLFRLCTLVFDGASAQSGEEEEGEVLCLENSPMNLLVIRMEKKGRTTRGSTPATSPTGR